MRIKKVSPAALLGLKANETLKVAIADAIEGGYNKPADIALLVTIALKKSGLKIVADKAAAA